MFPESSQIVGNELQLMRPSPDISISGKLIVGPFRADFVDPETLSFLFFVLFCLDLGIRQAINAFTA